MPNTSRTPLLTILSMTLAACGNKAEPPAPQVMSRAKPVPATTEAAPASASAPAPAPVVEPTWREPEAAGPVYLSFTFKQSIAMIDVDGKVRTVRGVTANHVHQTSDGQVLATLDVGQPSLRVYRIDGASATALPTLSMRGAAFGGNAIDARGDEVAVAFSSDDGKKVTLARLRGRAWETEIVEPAIGRVESIAFGANDEIWIGGASGFAVSRGGAWTMIECEYGCGEAGLAKVDDQVIVQKRERGEWRDYDVQGDKLVMRTGGPAPTWTSTNFGRNGSQLSIEDGKTRFALRHEAMMAKGTTIPWRAHARGAALDGAGRVWSIGDNALTVVDLKTAAITRYPQRAFGIDALELRQIVPVGGGPTLPAVVAPPVAEKVLVSLKVNGRPIVEGAQLRICPDATEASKPCGDSAPGYEVTAGPKGTFELTGVPQGTYDIVFKGKTSQGRVQWVVASNVLAIRAGSTIKVPVSLSLTEYKSYL